MAPGTHCCSSSSIEVCAIEPAIMELVVARIARLTYGSRVET